MFKHSLAILSIALLSACGESSSNMKPSATVNATEEFIASAESLGISISTIDKMCTDKGDFTVECKMFDGFSLSGNVGATYTTISYQRNSHDINANTHTSILVNLDLGMLEVYHSDLEVPDSNLHNSVNLNSSSNKQMLNNSMNYQNVSNWCSVEFEYTDSNSNPFTSFLPCTDEINIYPLLHDGWVITW